MIQMSIFNPLARRRTKGEVIAANKRQGQMAEDAFVMQQRLMGKEVERTGKGSDFRVRERNPFTGQVTKSELVEVKSGEAELSKLQQKTKNKSSHYKVVRIKQFV